MSMDNSAPAPSTRVTIVYIDRKGGMRTVCRNLTQDDLARVLEQVEELGE